MCAAVHETQAMRDDVWEELSQDIPSMSDPFMQQYLTGRANLIQQEKAKRSDASFRKSMSPLAKRASTIVERIRSHELKTVWTPDVEESIARDTHQSVFPGMMFRLAKDRIEATKLWNIIRRMPKGALLHAHLDAMVDFGFIFDELFKCPGMHISSDRPLVDKDALENAAVNFRFRTKTSSQNSIWDSSYTPESFASLTKAADEFPSGGKAGFLAWLKGRCTLSVEDSHEQHHGIDAIWKKFTKCFIVVATILHYEPMLRAYMRRLLSLLKDDGVNWVELRFALPTWPFTTNVLTLCVDLLGPSITAATNRRSLNPTTVTCSRSSTKRLRSSKQHRKERVSGE